MANVYLDPENAHARMAYAWKLAGEILKLGKRVKVTVSEYKPTRSLEQNDRLNAMCRDVSEQVIWHGNRLSLDDWRHMFVASYRKDQRVVPGFDGGFIVLAESSRGLKVDECGDVMEIIGAFGAEHGVEWKV